jgi:hypothetical protein
LILLFILTKTNKPKGLMETMNPGNHGSYAGERKEVYGITRPLPCEMESKISNQSVIKG